MLTQLLPETQITPPRRAGAKQQARCSTAATGTRGSTSRSPSASALQTGVFLCMLLLMTDVRDPRAVQEEALRRARAEAEEAALRRQAAPTWIDGEIKPGR